MRTELFPPIEPMRRGQLGVGDGHRLYFEVSGNAAGPPVLFLHGGPGSCTSAVHRRFFNPGHWRIVLFDQRGCGQSTPLGSLIENHTRALVHDIERLRLHLGVERWLLFGGSWGSTLALAYAVEQPQRVCGLVLRGVFLGSRAEIDWYLGGLGRFLPEARERLAGPDADVSALLSRYHTAVTAGEPTRAIEVAHRWQAYENAIMAVGESPAEPAEVAGEALLARVRIQLHYLVNDCFLAPGALLEGVPRIAGVPGIVVQGRRDLVCPPRAAYTLTQHWAEGRLRIVEEAGHSALHPAMSAALVQAVEDMKALAPEACP